ncbi:unnamed protein product [Cuscuta europaea]|uniref:Uncharacterized protein n=1 Tax=Cuscuta europaea TaxID=41803 RepID=A0A9P0ZCC1_CUSEU|nr:unnamed protein product [Cuscuta europaea]
MYEHIRKDGCLRVYIRIPLTPVRVTKRSKQTKKERRRKRTTPVRRCRVVGPFPRRRRRDRQRKISIALSPDQTPATAVDRLGRQHHRKIRPISPVPELSAFGSPLRCRHQVADQGNCCEVFLHSCSDIRGHLQVYHGTEDAYFVTGEDPILRQIHLTFELNKHSTLFFLKYGRGRALLLAISSCGLEDVPKHNNTYEISSATCYDGSSSS